MFKPKSKVNPRNKGGATELYFSSLEELMTVEVPKGKFNNLANREWEELHDLKNDRNIEIISAEKCAAVVV